MVIVCVSDCSEEAFRGFIGIWPDANKESRLADTLGAAAVLAAVLISGIVRFIPKGFIFIAAMFIPPIPLKEAACDA